MDQLFLCLLSFIKGSINIFNGILKLNLHFIFLKQLFVRDIQLLIQIRKYQNQEIISLPFAYFSSRHWINRRIFKLYKEVIPTWSHQFYNSLFHNWNNYSVEFEIPGHVKFKKKIFMHLITIFKWYLCWKNK